MPKLHSNHFLMLPLSKLQEEVFPSLQDITKDGSKIFQKGVTVHMEGHDMGEICSIYFELLS